MDIQNSSFQIDVAPLGLCFIPFLNITALQAALLMPPRWGYKIKIRYWIFDTQNSSFQIDAAPLGLCFIPFLNITALQAALLMPPRWGYKFKYLICLSTEYCELTAAN
ncbi:MAG: hypothetical protein EOM83_05810 [Clostridia bacterium]|nr:hypothetical protein [Clostridia bacterium]